MFMLAFLKMHLTKNSDKKDLNLVNKKLPKLKFYSNEIIDNVMLCYDCEDFDWSDVI